MPNDWPDPPLFAHHVLEDPWTLAVALLALAVVVFIAGGRLGHRRVQIAAIAPALIAGVVIVSAHLVRTERERMLDATRALVDAALTPFDTEHLGAVADAAFVMTAGGGDAAAVIVADRAALLAAVDRAARTVAVKSARISNALARSDGPGVGRTYIALFSEAAGPMGAGLAKTQWVFHWRREADGRWTLTRAEWLSLNDRPVRPSLLP